MNHMKRIYQSFLFLTAWLALVAVCAADEAKEKELLAVLRSDAAKADKAITCKLLAIHGSSEAVPDLAPLLADPQLASWARIALEAIPGPEAGEALRKATDSVDGLLLIGVINSIGVRRDAESVETLAKHLKNKDSDAASAAAVALGRVGNAEATQALREALAVPRGYVLAAVAEGCVLCAEHLLADGKAEDAAAIYDEVRKAEVPKPRLLEATRGAILARGKEGIPLLVEQLRSDDIKFFQIALSTAREFPGGDVDQALAEELERADADRAALIVQAMADRPETVVVAAVLKAAEAGDNQVRLSAIDALRRVGDGSCVASLLEIAIGADADLAQAARKTLADLPGEKVNAQIAELLPKAQGKSYPVLIELVGQRRIEATQTLLKALDQSDPAVRQAALAALGETVDLKGLPVLISQAVTPKNSQDAAAAQQALKAAAVRMPDREACATELAAAYQRASSTPTKVTLLETLGAVGGTKALATMAAAAKSANDPLQDASTRLLGEWMTADAAPVLLDLAKSAPGEKYQVRSMRGYIRIARQFDLPEAERTAMCQKAFAEARPAEQKLVLDVLKRYPSAESLQLAAAALEVPQLRDDANLAVLAIAQNLAGKGIDVSKQLAQAGLARVKLEIVKAEYGAGSTQKDVTTVLQKYAGDLPLVVLPSSFNANFGDPVPGAVKQLKVQYRINGKPGEATFAENAPILLPTPK
jgi:HEAT repeat protein